ncbi:MAG TPA: hypothetical protein VGL76_08940 [Gaiellaceae bacterium]|jgi:hypothetical protein
MFSLRDTFRRARGRHAQPQRATGQSSVDDGLAPVVDLFANGVPEVEPASAAIVHVVGAIRREAPELAGDLRDAIGVWFEVDELRPSDSSRTLSERRERLWVLSGALRQQTVDLDPRD